MKGFFIASLLLAFSSCSRAGGAKHFVCDMLRDGFKKPLDPERPYDGKLNYFDCVFYWQKTGGVYETGFYSPGTGFDVRFKDGVLSRAFLRTAREQQGFYREIFDVYRFNTNEKTLIHSYVYYLDPEDFERNFNNPLFTPYEHPPLYDLIEKKPPENYVKIGWDKTKWQCYEISRFKYWRLNWVGILTSLISG